MSHKHRNLLSRIGGGNSELESYESGSPKSTLSDRQQMTHEDDFENKYPDDQLDGDQ